MTHRSILLLAIAAGLGLAAVSLRTTASADDHSEPGAHAASDRHSANHVHRAQSQRQQPALAGVLRDHTGEPLGAGPARKLELPPRSPTELDNTLGGDRLDNARARVLRRLDDEIADVGADPATIRRLEIRRARIERKRRGNN